MKSLASAASQCGESPFSKRSDGRTSADHTQLEQDYIHTAHRESRRDRLRTQVKVSSPCDPPGMSTNRLDLEGMW